jgi:hypothetical protein
MLEYAGAAGGFIDQYGILTAEGAFLNHRKRHRTIRRRNRNILGFRSLFFYKKRRLQRATRFDDDFLPIRKKSICWRAINKGYDKV